MTVSHGPPGILESHLPSFNDIVQEQKGNNGKDKVGPSLSPDQVQVRIVKAVGALPDASSLPKDLCNSKDKDTHKEAKVDGSKIHHLGQQKTDQRGQDDEIRGTSEGEECTRHLISSVLVMGEYSVIRQVDHRSTNRSLLLPTSCRFPMSFRATCQSLVLNIDKPCASAL